MRGIRGILEEIWSGSDNFTVLMEKGKIPDAKIVKSQFIREQVENTTFEKLQRYHDLTPQIQIAVSSYTELITGTEMLISSDDERAKDILDEWIDKTGFYDKFESIVRTILICGNAILELLDEHDITDVAEVDMSTIIAKRRTDVGELMYYEQRVQTGGTAKLGEGNLDRFIEFQLTSYSKQAWGKSLFFSLAVPRTTDFRTTAPMVEVMWGMEDAMAAMLQNNAFPITTITYPGANDKYLEKEAERWRRYKPGDKRVQKIKPDIEFFETQPSSKYTDYVEHLSKMFEMGTQFPHDIMTGDFTSRASSETTENLVMKKVRGFQRYIGNRLKVELFDKILLQQGIDPDQADIKVSFTAQNVIELEPEHVSKLFTDEGITINELRNWFRENTGIELPDDDVIKQDMEDKKQQQQDQFDQKAQAMDGQMKDLKGKIEHIKEKTEFDHKNQYLYDKMDEKLKSVQNAMNINQDELVKKKNTDT